MLDWINKSWICSDDFYKFYGSYVTKNFNSFNVLPVYAAIFIHPLFDLVALLGPEKLIKCIAFGPC